MSETRKIAAIWSRTWSAIPGSPGGRDRTLARLRALRSDLIDPTIPRASWSDRQADCRWQQLSSSAASSTQWLRH